MSFGFKTLDAAGNDLFTTEQRLIRVMHVERVLSDSPSRRVDIPGLRADRAYFITQSDTAFRRGPVAAIFDGYIQVIGPQTAGTSAGLSSNGYITIIGYG